MNHEDQSPLDAIVPHSIIISRQPVNRDIHSHGNDADDSKLKQIHVEYHYEHIKPPYRQTKPNSYYLFSFFFM